MRFGAITIVGMLLCATPVLYGQNVIDRIAAVVNDDIITEAEIDRTMVGLEKQYQSRYSGDELRIKLMEARSEVLEKLIDNLLVYQEAVERGITIKSQEVDESAEKVMVKFPNKEAFIEALKYQDITEQAFRENIKKQLVIKKYKQYFIINQTNVLSSEIKDFYDQYKNQFMEPEEVRASQIYIGFKQDGGQEYAKSKIHEIKKALNEGESFESLARQFSEDPAADRGGDLGFLKRGQMLKEIEEVLFRMLIGDTSEVIESSSGYHILKLTGRKEPRQKSFEEVQEQARQAVFAQKADESMRKKIDELREKGYVEIKSQLGA